MGCGMSTEEKEGKARNEEIENQLKRDRMQQRNEIKMLLLGMFIDCFHSDAVDAVAFYDFGARWRREIAAAVLR